MPASIDVVIPAYNHYSLTSSCLRLLERQTIDHRVIVVDNGSSDDTFERLRRDWPSVSALRLASNQDYTQAVSYGVDAGDGEYIVLLNNDVELRSDFLEQLIVPLQRDPATGSVAGLMLAPGETRIDSFGVTADPTLAGFARLQGLPVAAAQSCGPVLTGPEGTAGAYRRSAWEQVGGLDNTIRAYMEILDLALRLRAAGWKAAAAGGAVGVHLGSRTYGRGSPAQRRLAGFSRGYLLRRYGVLRGRVAARAIVTETVVVFADLLISRDLEATHGRVAGWRAARGRPRYGRPPQEAIDSSISLRRSMGLRRATLRAEIG